MKTKYKHKCTYFIWISLMILCAIFEFTIGIGNSKTGSDIIWNVITGMVAVAFAISELIYYNRDKNNL